jgi:4-alpha-glucanotransferase
MSKGETHMARKRRCGILCHPTCLPGPFGIGDLGEAAYRLVDFLASAGQSVWQVLPLGPTGYGDSPYQPFSAFAGNPLLIDPRQLVEDGLLTERDLTLPDPFADDRVHYGEVIAFKQMVLRRAHGRLGLAPEAVRQEYAAFCEAQRDWLDDYCLFMALKQRHAWAGWFEWPREIALRAPEALARWRHELRDEVGYHSLVQFLFERQWQRLHAYAQGNGIQIIGDLPIFVGHDSADVWGNQALFQLDEQGHPTVVAGVPPDYFSPTGQRWGNPLYRWERLAESGHAWWLRRLQRVLSQVDVVRIDHFRGFVAYWEVPADAPTAINGRWAPGPGRAFFDAVRAALGDLPIIAEDLGLITEDVTALRQELGLPGMTVLHFAFGGPSTNPHLPFNHERNSVVYTGTHDNDTTMGWYANLGEREAHRVRVYTGSDGSEIHWRLIRLALTSVSDLAIYPLQDVLGLGSWARMNYPGRAQNNWTWRYTPEALQPELAETLAELARVTGRHPACEDEDANAAKES